MTIPFYISSVDRVRVYHGDCVRVMESMPSRTYQLIFADPPFNINYEYDQYVDKISPEDFEQWCILWIEQCSRLISYHGSIVVAIGDEYAAPMKIMLDRYFTMRNWLIWHYTFGVHCENKFGRDHTHLLYYVKNPKKFIFNANDIRIKSSRLEIGDKRANPEGRVPGDVWTVPRLVGNANERVGHPCQMPESILERLVLALTNPRDNVLDPFAGSGTTLSVAQRLGRFCDGIEISQQYILNHIIPRLTKPI